ncbi:MAG: UDP-N-acetylmuramate dehydrogenase [Acidobacteria bacterium]|nr:UDP-N-acetylmuramate dehydrogenase [Acidobacteriota bacterium]
MTAIEVAAQVLGELAQRDVPLGPLTTYRVGGPAALFVEVDGDDALARVAGAVRASGVDVLVVGKGSNLLVADAGFDGLAVVLGEAFATIEIDGTTVRAGGSVALPVLARRTAAAGLTGLEWAVGVPGSVGGGVRMNAGGHGSDIAATLRRVRVVDLTTGEDGVVRAADLDLGYRRSAVAPTQLVAWAEFELQPGDADGAAAEIAEIVRWRRENQPGGQNGCSVFTNPPGASAGRLIDDSGCKGLRRGTAEVSVKHANFFQADAGGSADDLAALIDEVQRRVQAATGVLLVPENRIVGFDAPPRNPRAEVEG